MEPEGLAIGNLPLPIPIWYLASISIIGFKLSVDKRKNLNGSLTIVSYYINKDYYGGYMLTLSINNENKEYLYSSAMMGAGEILEGPIGSRGSCKKL